MRALSAAAPIALVLAGAGTAEAAETRLQRSVEWSGDWWILASLAVAALWYVAGITRLRRRLGAGRVIGRWEIVSFTLGLGTIFLALESPIDSISDQLFSVHMLQHLLLMLIAAPLLVWGRPAVAFLWAFAPGGRKRIGRLWAILGLQSGTRAIMHPITVWLLYYTVFESANLR